MPLSNPTSRVEAQPADILRWTGGNALVATGSPFLPVIIGDKTYPIAQCNNSFIFPGIGLGVIASGARRVTDAMLMAASEALAECSPMKLNPTGNLLPDLNSIQDVSKAIAKRVAEAAQKDKVAEPMTAAALDASIVKNYWLPVYRNYVSRSAQ